MAFSDLANWFIRFYRERQERIAQKTRYEMSLIAPMLDFERLDETQIPWSRAGVAIIERNRRESVQAARQLVNELRWDADPMADPIHWGDLDEPDVFVGGDDFEAVPDVLVDAPDFDDVDVVVEVPDDVPGVWVDAPDFDDRDATVSLLVTGPERVKAQMPAPEDEAMGKAQSSSAAAAVRHVVDGGREQVKLVAQRAPDVVGYARVTDSDPCYFCAALASRGPVYKDAHVFDSSDARFTGSGAAKVHDGCACSLILVFDHESWPEGSPELEEFWLSATGDYSGKDKMRAFRRAYEERKRGTPQRGPRKSGDDKPARPREPGKAAPETVRKTTREVALSQINVLNTNLDKLLDNGLPETDPRVQYHRKQIARFDAMVRK